MGKEDFRDLSEVELFAQREKTTSQDLFREKIKKTLESNLPGVKRDHPFVVIGIILDEANKDLPPLNIFVRTSCETEGQAIDQAAELNRTKPEIGDSRYFSVKMNYYPFTKNGELINNPRQNSSAA